MEKVFSIGYDGPVPQRDATRKIGLARALSKLGHCSRSQAVELIHAGRVQFDGKVQRHAEAPVRLGSDRIAIDGNPVEREKKIYLVMNKPRGLVTTASDEKGRNTIYSLLEGESLPWVAPVGRLDKASEGLLLLTNDTEWSGRVAAPETHLQKTYHVQINKLADEKFLGVLTRGVKAEGQFLRARSASLLRSGKKNSWLEITLDEGKNRQIRRMLAAMDVEVLRLVRVAIGPLELGTLAKGTWRYITSQEKDAIDQATRHRQHPQRRAVVRPV
jgi:23S rRNA pseudouridine2605 synthase